MKFYEYILKIIFPPKCIVCGEVMPYLSEPPYLCDHCTLTEFPVKTCEKCGKPYDIGYGEVNHCMYCTSKYPFEFLVSPHKYDGNVKNVIHNLKFRDRPYIYKSVAHIIASRYTAYTYHFPDICVPAPIGKKRLNKRGYNQAALIAKEVSRLLGISYAEPLEKIIDVPPQSTLTREQRAENLKGTIACNTELDGKSVLFIDDVHTTGSTIAECCRMLKKGGAGKIYVATFAVTGKE